ncbi:MAG TPA: hypothetical protein VD862_02695 [Candidatus Paceibacterota bacterium]|nr:hypothetical protein [Candidatus Paceibacterota bacterium]
MNKGTLHEVAKFLSGVIAADFLVLWWMGTSDLLPVNILGQSFDAQGAAGAMVFDAVLFALLVWYGWRRPGKARGGMRPFHWTAGIIFGAVSVLHLLRILLGWEFTIASWAVPYWLNGIASAVAGFLAVASFHLLSKDR